MTLFKNIPSVEIVSIDLFDIYRSYRSILMNYSDTGMCHNDHKRLDLPTGRGEGGGGGGKGGERDKGGRGGVLTRFLTIRNAFKFLYLQDSWHPRFKSGSVTIIDDRATTIRRRFTRFKEIKLFASDCFLIFLNEFESMVRSWMNACLVEIQITPDSIQHLHAL